MFLVFTHVRKGMHKEEEIQIKGAMNAIIWESAQPSYEQGLGGGKILSSNPCSTYHSLVVWFWPSYLFSSCLNFFFCEMEIMTHLWVFCEDYMCNMFSPLAVSRSIKATRQLSGQRAGWQEGKKGLSFSLLLRALN